MANKDDYLTCYREFFENFAKTVNVNDQLPVKLANYKLLNWEVIGAVIDWTTQYLTQKKCPQNLLVHLIQLVIDETRKACKKEPTSSGFIPSANAYEPLRLMQSVIAKTNDICLRYLDNSQLCSLPSPGQIHNVVSVCAARNKRRSMEDRHVIIPDLNTIFNIQEASPSSYYAIFDGHRGHDAADYSAVHLHQYLAESKYFPSNPEQALKDAFCKTDALFLEKVENFNSGTTAVCALLRPKEKTLYVAWVGDSQALLVNQGRVLQCVHPHKPNREDEKRRIEEAGGFVSYWGTWRVDGQLAVSRAIGDSEYKPYVTAVPDIREIPLDGGEDFLILACDGLWDFLSEDDAAGTVYNMVYHCPDKTDLISEKLVQLAKERGSADNISVIIVFLREPSKIAAEAPWPNRNASPITMDAQLDNNNPFFASANVESIIPQKSEGLLLNLSESFKQNGDEVSPSDDYLLPKSNGKKSVSEFDDDDDLGPETDVDAVDDVLSPSIVAAKALAEGIVNNNPDGSFNPFVERHEVAKVAMEVDIDIQKKQGSEFDGQRSPREETPTPPADTVHGVLEENLAAESGDESEDEWNYITGEEANKENVSPSSNQLDQVDDEGMSQLNPDAEEFVPVSPTRTAPSPPCRMAVNDAILSQSPRKPLDIDINLPADSREFESEAKSRPSDLDSNGEENQEEPKITSLMESIVNGRNIEEIPEFHPQAAGKPDEFHFGPNAAPFAPLKNLDQADTSNTTNDPFEDDIIGFNRNESFAPMTASFFGDNENGLPDLNKVQVLPDNLDEFLSKPDGDLKVEKLPTTDIDDEVTSPIEQKPVLPTQPETEEVALVEAIGELIVTEIKEEVKAAVVEPVTLSSTPGGEIVNEVTSPIEQSAVLPTQPENEEVALAEPLGELTQTEIKEEITEIKEEVKSAEPVTLSPSTPGEEACALHFDINKREIPESPLEEVTSSIKDLASPVPPISSPGFFGGVADANKSTTDSDVDSFLEGFLQPSQVAITSPLSPVQNPEIREKPSDLLLNDIDISLQDATAEEVRLPEPVAVDVEKSAPPVEEIAVAAAPTVAGVKGKPVKKAAADKKSPLKAATEKKSTISSSSKTSSGVVKKTTGALKPTLSPTKPKVALSSAAGAKPKTAPINATGAIPKFPPRTNPTAAPRKPLTNGEVKTEKPAQLSKPSRPLTAPSRTTTKPATTTTATAKPRTTFTGRTAATASTRPTSSTVTRSESYTIKRLPSATKSPSAPSHSTLSPTKARPAPLAAKPRVPLTRTITRPTANSEKLNKDAVNTLTASRTVARTTTRTTTTTTKKTEIKASNRTTPVKTSTTTKAVPAKKPVTITKTKQVEKPIENGVSTVVTEQIVNNINELVKDNSPVDNKLISEPNATD